MIEQMEELVHPKHTAVVVIDVQNDFCSIKGAFGRTMDHALMCEAAENMVKFLRVARFKHVPIIHVKVDHSEWTDSPAWLARGKDKPKGCRVGTWGADWWEEYPELMPTKNEYIVVKHRYSGFVGTDLDLVLRSKEITTVILAGVSTDGCVEATGRDALSLEYRVIVLADCTAAKNREMHKFGLESIGRRFGVIATSEEVMNAWPHSNSSRYQA